MCRVGMVDGRELGFVEELVEMTVKLREPYAGWVYRPA